MQMKFVDWRSDREVEEERLALTYHANSNHYPQLDVLTRTRMKMLNRLFAQMNAEATPAKRYFAAARHASSASLMDHPLAASMLERLERLQREALPFLDFDRFREAGGARLDAPEMYIVSRSTDTGRFELFYCNPFESILERVKAVEDRQVTALFDPDYAAQAARGAVFVTANINRSLKLFGERGYRLSLLEGGRLTERLAAGTAGTEVALQPTLGFYDEPVNELLGLDGFYDVVLSCLIIREEE
ncbi:nitroreductase family protein [Paenibacillus xanthanilyticus]|uniref:Nitroreductase domain-containing protein n=1 Tax=Paenibacillus xanthanilyticus TaxID=1783531 RepID=A0ABV8JW61_9BACL